MANVKQIDIAIASALEDTRRINRNHRSISKESAEFTLRFLAFQFLEKCGSQGKRLAEFEVLQTDTGFETKGQIDDDGDIYEYRISATLEEESFQYEFECISGL